MQGLAWRQACRARPLHGSRHARPLHGSQAQMLMLLELLLLLLLYVYLIMCFYRGVRSATLELRNKYIQQKQQTQQQHLCQFHFN